jgi:hypothetical protein
MRLRSSRSCKQHIFFAHTLRFSPAFSSNYELDGKKNGYAIKTVTHQSYSSTWDRRARPACMITDPGTDTSNSRHPDCSENVDLPGGHFSKGCSSDFILNIIQKMAQDEIQEHNQRFPPPPNIRSDDELIKPLRDLEQYINSHAHRASFIQQRDALLKLLDSASTTSQISPGPAARPVVDFYPPWLLDKELEFIRAHVKEAKKQFLEAVGSPALQSAKSPLQSPDKKKKVAATRKSSQVAFDEVAKFYAEGPDSSLVPILTATGRVEALKASYALSLSTGEKQAFAFNVAFRELCKIKSGSSDLSHRYIFMDKMSIQSSVTRVLKGRVAERMEQEKAAKSGGK